MNSPQSRLLIPRAAAARRGTLVTTTPPPFWGLIPLGAAVARRARARGAEA
jgi:hypothetical protein